MNTLTTIHNNGIVNQCEITHHPNNKEDKNLTQVIWNGELRYHTIGLNSVEDECLVSTPVENFRVVYLNGVMIVKNGKVWPRPTLFKRINGFR